MRPSCFPLLAFLALTTALAAIAPASAQPFPWSAPHARVLPQGELEPTPEPFVFTPRSPLRYIDFEHGDDSRSGTSPESAWKHHPWDPAAGGLARSTRGPHTYVFKRGVVYRGVLRPGDDAGEPGLPIQLTSDPAWGVGEAAIVGSERVSGWRRGAAHPRIPEADRVWTAEVDFLPRTLWVVDEANQIVRLKLARTPNWNEPDPNDVMSEWWTWDNPEWWRGAGHQMEVERRDGKVRLHLGINRRQLVGSAEDYVGGTVWSEWGIVMGSPYPAEIEGFSENERGVAFRGPWTFAALEKIIRGNRFFLENKPQWLDEPGEFWVERIGDGPRARIHLRLPGDRDPGNLVVEAGRHHHILDARRLDHVEISGLSFRFTNVAWRYNVPSWADPDLQAGVIRLNGSGDGIRIRNNLFEHVHQPVRINATAGSRIGTVAVTDNVMRHTDHGAIWIRTAFEDRPDGGRGHIDHVDILRNQLHHIGWRIISGEHGHAIDVTYPVSSHIAGNFLHRIAGWGISVFGGKPSTDRAGSFIHTVTVPFSRHLIHHNRVEDVLLKSNDWGGIETWQGGPFYVFNNLVINPVGFKHWTWKPGDPANIGSFGHAYYLDGSFKNYLFNNLALGRNNELGTRSVNSTALQNIYSFENTFFHNSFVRFAAMTRQQSPDAGRFRYLANVMADSSSILFRHADPKKGEPDPNASHYTQGGRFDYPTLAYSNNVLHEIRGDIGVFEETGVVYSDFEGFRAALAKVRPLADSVGIIADRAPLVDPAARDFRPVAESPALGRGHRVFVPWALHAVVGEWHFLLNHAEPGTVMDEHWFMGPAHGDRSRYRLLPRHPLRGVGVGAADFIAGSLEDWTRGALRLDGATQHLVLEPVSSPSGPDGVSTRGRDVDMEENSFILEAVLSTRADRGLVVGKLTSAAGYALDLVEGRPRLRLRAEGAEHVSLSELTINDGEPRHLLVEVDRAAGAVRFHVDGRRVESSSSGIMPRGSLANEADFLVGGGPRHDFLAATFDFLRVARGTLADARTTIEELHAWQFDGPQTRDFAGVPRHATHAAGALVSPTENAGR